MSRNAHLLCPGAVLALAMMVGTGASAQGWQALTIGNTSPATPGAAAEAGAAAAALTRMGATVQDRLEEADAATMAAAFTVLAAAPRAVIYFSGPLSIGKDGEILFGTGGATPVFAGQLSLDTIADRMAAAETRELVVVIEDCTAVEDGAPGALSGLTYLPEAPLDLLLVASAGPGGLCGSVRPRATELLTRGDEPADGIDGFAAAFAGASVMRLEPPPGVLPDTGRTVAPGADFGPMTLALGPAAPDELVAVPDGFEQGTGRRGAPSLAPGGASVTRIGIRPDDPIIRERAGSRQPSILIGVRPQELEELQALLETTPEEPPEEPPAALPATPRFDDRVARDELRESNPEGFATLVATGALDPPDPTQVALALQAELQGMNCYTSALDNDWGPGSVRGLEAYATQRGVDAASIAPGLGATMELWRNIISNPPVTCPAATASAPAARQTSGGSARPSGGTTQRQTPPAGTQNAAPKKTISTTSFGNFR